MHRTAAHLSLALGLCVVTASAAADDLAGLSTDFDDPATLSTWSEHAPEGFIPKWQAPRVDEGLLILEPKSSGWFEDNQAGHLYHPIAGDFIVTTRMAVRGTEAALPQTPFSLAGLFIRSPRPVSAASWTPGQENWLFFSIGTAAPAGEPHYEIKSTTNSLSTLKILPSGTGWVELRIARHGELFTLLHRPEGTPDWQVIDQMIRPDLPHVLNVGLTAYADYASVQPTYPNYQLYNTEGAAAENADLVATVDRITFRRPVTGRLPVANIDAPAFLEAIADRKADLHAD